MVISMPVRLEYCNPTFLLYSSQYSLDNHYLTSTMFHKLCQVKRIWSLVPECPSEAHKDIPQCQVGIRQHGSTKRRAFVHYGGSWANPRKEGI